MPLWYVLVGRLASFWLSDGCFELHSRDGLWQDMSGMDMSAPEEHCSIVNEHDKDLISLQLP